MVYLRKIILYQAVLLLCTLTLPATGQTLPYANSRFGTIDSILLHYRVWNDNYAPIKGKILLIHGFIGSSYCWRMNADALAAAGYKVITVDLPSFGYSSRSITFNQSQASRGKLIWKLLNHIDQGDTSRWHICGHSMGGGTAEAMALLRPDRTRSLTIVNGMVFLKNTHMESQFSILVRQKYYNRIMVNLIEKRVFTYRSVKNALRRNYRFEPDSTVVQNYLTPLLQEGTAASILNVWANAREDESLHADGLKNIPVLVIWGSKDRTIYLRTGKRFVRQVPHAQLLVIHKAGHSPMETHADVFNSLLIGFLGKNP